MRRHSQLQKPGFSKWIMPWGVAFLLAYGPVLAQEVLPDTKIPESQEIETPHDQGKGNDSGRTTAKDIDRDAENSQSSRSQQMDAAYARPPITEVAKTTSHSLEVRGETIVYEATAGTLTIRDDKGMPTASVFYVAYTVAHEDDQPRPVTFFYNGGPGSASLWLHMGSFGPVRAKTDEPKSLGSPPYELETNSETLIDKTDMVFIDAVGTGYSRPLDGTGMDEFTGVDQDAEAFSRAIIRYVTLNKRWNAPKFLLGESYGATRSAVVANLLESRGVAVNGAILLSPILDYTVLDRDRYYVNMLPTYAAAAWYHDKVVNKPENLEDFIQQAREFSGDTYVQALAEGDLISEAKANEVAQQMSHFIGLSAAYLLQSNLRVPEWRFRKELLRDQRLTIGRFDARYTGMDEDAAGGRAGMDPSETAVKGAYHALLRDYLVRMLEYDSDLDYRVLHQGEVGEWDWSHNRHQSPKATVDLSEVIRKNPHFKVISLNGYYDLATPFLGTEYDLSHLSLEPVLRQNISIRYYPSGHMIYLNPDALAEMRNDVVEFLEEAIGDR
ncbi:S10 family peptidase [Litchfieldella rifensis]|uniref:S10 family peptidase n=1 Tax=Litchfieldella rifensis TaxID=762643 RepID=A0ABV7LLV0_9GAMM